MDSITFLILVGFIWLILVSVSRTSWFKVKNPEIGLGFAYYRTTKLNNIITRIAHTKESFWKLLWDIGILSGLGILFTGLVFFTINVTFFLPFFLPKSSEVITPIVITPVIPGITISFGSLPYFIVAILIGAAVHEFAHGIAAINEKISLKSTGIFVFLVLFGAFVEPSEESYKASSNRSKMRVMAAGGLANMLVSIILIIILILPFGFPLLISPFFQTNPSGVLVIETVPNSPAYNASIKAGYAFTAIEIDSNVYNLSSGNDFQSVISQQLLANQTLMFHFSDNIESIPLNSSTRSLWYPDEENLTRGYIGVLTTNYFKPHFQTNILFINLIPYWALMTITYTFMINLMLALMNLLPVPFLDGDKLLAAFFGDKHPVFHRRIKYFALIILLLNFALSFYFMGWQQL
ncbi:MAG: site-2 protease family protein [Candidatus Hodarchaeales archaeon]|jgi:membrane-associated protease RseP (regulator of RpoE activity)